MTDMDRKKIEWCAAFAQVVTLKSGINVSAEFSTGNNICFEIVDPAISGKRGVRGLHPLPYSPEEMVERFDPVGVAVPLWGEIASWADFMLYWWDEMQAQAA